MSEPEVTHTKVLYIHMRSGYVRGPVGDRVRIGPSPLVIGRDPHCALVVEDKEVSATHCELRAEAQGVRITDASSKNGTYVNGIRIREAFLNAPATLEIGNTRLTFEPGERETLLLGQEDRFGAMVGTSLKMRQIFRVLSEVATTDLSVLVMGETGSGKEFVGQSLHEQGARASGPFVVVDCRGASAMEAESIMFGHEPGAFPGATERRIGALHEAHQGTLFLKELAELPIELQPKLLRALTERRVKRIGGHRYEPIDVRVVASSRRDLGRAMNTGRFRGDLFFHLAQVRVELPPLRDRRDDIPVLIPALCERQRVGAKAADVAHRIIGPLAQHDWPGNVRELANIISVAAHLPAHAELAGVLPIESGSISATEGSMFADAKRDALTVFESHFFSDLSRATHGNVSEMARRSGLARHHVRAYLRKHNIGVEK